METYAWKGSQQSYTVVVNDMWHEYRSATVPQEIDYMQRLDMLQESIRRCMRAEYESYLNGRATAARVAETRGHAVLLGKIIVALEREAA
jgi:hypothetical protein